MKSRALLLFRNYDSKATAEKAPSDGSPVPATVSRRPNVAPTDQHEHHLSPSWLYGVDRTWLGRGPIDAFDPTRSLVRLLLETECGHFSVADPL